MELVNIEDQIIKATIKALVAEGFLLSVNDGEETTVRRSFNEAAIFEAMKTTDEDYILVFEVGGAKQLGWIRFIYGNDDTEVINDYAISLEPVMFEINTMIDRYEDRI